MKYTIENVRELFDEVGYDLISEEYINNRTPLKYICRRHPDKGIQEIRLSDLLSGSRCVYCRYEDGLPYGRPWPDDIIKDALDELDCDFVSKYTRNGHSVIQFICRKHPNKGIQETDWTKIKQKMRICKVCNGNDRSTEDFKEMVFKINPSIEIIGEYKGARETILCRCKIDGHIWEPIAYNLLSGYGCPVCAKKRSADARRIPYEEKLKILEEKHPDIEFLYVPETTKDYVHCRCKKCGCEWWATYTNLVKPTRSTGCPHCNKSTSEKELARILNKWNLNFIPQHRYEDLRDKNQLPFDFYLIDFGVEIEFDGEHHYMPINRYKNDPNGEKAMRDFQLTMKHDNMKTQYCYDHNILLIRIPYWHREDLEYFLFDELVRCNVIELVN